MRFFLPDRILKTIRRVLAARPFGGRALSPHEIDLAELDFTRSSYGPWLLTSPDDQTFHFCVRGYGPLIADALKARKRDFLFLDIGANVGIFSLVAAGMPRCRAVIAIEPVPDTFRKLEINTRRNRAGKVTPVRGAVCGGHKRDVHLSYNPLHSGMASLSKKRGGAVRAPALRARDLSKLVPAHWERIVVKIDVEGSELEVLNELRRTVFYPAVNDILIEMSSLHSGRDGVEAIIAFMRAEGFAEIAKRGGKEHYDAHYRRPGADPALA
ncbi:MAG: hypothetical protein C0605_11155 [Hyphomicrobiales bacterium]|nr:MAG: hypothetical protein C0605_11155 [Hyphomicrobiales bacterium]